MLIESLFAAFPVYLRPVFIVARSDKRGSRLHGDGNLSNGNQIFSAWRDFRHVGSPPAGGKGETGSGRFYGCPFVFFNLAVECGLLFRRDFERGGKAIKIAALHEMIHVNDHGGKPIQITGFVVVGYAGRQRGRIERFIQQRIQNLRHIPAREQRFHGIVDIGPFLVVDVSVATGGENQRLQQQQGRLIRRNSRGRRLLQLGGPAARCGLG